MENSHARIASRAVSAVPPLSSLQRGKGIIPMHKEVENEREKYGHKDIKRYIKRQCVCRKEVKSKWNGKKA